MMRKLGFKVGYLWLSIQLEPKICASVYHRLHGFEIRATFPLAGEVAGDSYILEGSSLNAATQYFHHNCAFLQIVNKRKLIKDFT
jgi:hypothetical protein